MQQPQEIQQPEVDDISVIDILKIVKKLFQKIWVHKFKFLLIAFLAGVLGFSWGHFKRSMMYISHLTFAVEEKSGAGGIAGLASQFGLDVGSGGTGLFSSDNLMLLLKSKRIIHQSLLTPIPELKGNTLFNLYLERNYKEHLKIGKVKLLDPNKDINQFTRKEDSLLNVVGLAVKGSVTLTKLDKKASIIDVQVIGVDEAWTYYFNKMLITKASQLYQDMKVGKSRRTVEVLASRVDSVKKALDNAMSSAAIESDRNQALVLMQARVPAAKTQMQVQLLTTMYGELVKNLEISKLSLEREEPVIEVIDEPTMPLEKKGKGRALLAIISAILAFIASTVSFLLFDYLKAEWQRTSLETNTP